MSPRLRHRYEVLCRRYNDRVEQARCARNLAVQHGTEDEAIDLECVAQYWETFLDVTRDILAGEVKPVGQ